MFRRLEPSLRPHAEAAKNKVSAAAGIVVHHSLSFPDDP